MAHAISPKGVIEIVTPGTGPERQFRLHHFYGRSDTGLIPASFVSGENTVAIIDVGSGKDVSSSFNTTVETGGISLTDTGAGGVFAGTFSNRDLIAITTDTGTAGN